MDKGFSPVGLRVLVVDDDPTWLKILEKMLKKCSYEGLYLMFLDLFRIHLRCLLNFPLLFEFNSVTVTTCGLAREALRLLRERKDGYDIVISDVNMPDMDGFKLLEHVGLELDLPVISQTSATSRYLINEQKRLLLTSLFFVKQ